MFKKFTMLLCASLFFIGQSALASEGEAVADKAAEAAKEMTKEATAAGAPADEEKMKMKEAATQDENMQEAEKKDEKPAE
jgi:hypothetical protein